MAEIQGKTTPTRLEADILRAFGMLGERPTLIGSRLDRSIDFMETVLPGWGYIITMLPVPNNQEHIVTKLIEPAKNPDGGVTDGSSWSRHFSAAGRSAPVSMLRAVFVALRDKDIQ